MVVLIQSENHAANKEKTAGRYQFDTHPTGIGLNNHGKATTYTIANLCVMIKSLNSNIDNQGKITMALIFLYPN